MGFWRVFKPRILWEMIQFRRTCFQFGWLDEADFRFRTFSSGIAGYEKKVFFVAVLHFYDGTFLMWGELCTRNQMVKMSCLELRY